MTPNNQTITDIEEVLSLFRTSFDAFYEALKSIKVQEQIEQYDWVQHDESKRKQSNTYYEVIKTKTIHVPLTDYLDYYPGKPPAEF